MTEKPICPYCRTPKEVARENMPAGLRWITCQSCGQRFEFRLQQVKTHLSTKEPFTGLARVSRVHGMGLGQRSPWERRSELGLWQGIFQTVKAVLFSPEAFFRSLIAKEGIAEPLAFGLLLGSFGNMLGLFWKVTLLGRGLGSSFPGIFEESNMSAIFLITMGLIPVFVTLAMFIVGAVLHLMFFILGAGERGFEATFRAVSYSQAAQAWGMIPFLGGWIAGIWQLIIQIIGLREIHQTSYLKVILAFAIPVAIILLMLIACAILVFIYLGEHGPELLGKIL
jgi:hypothetical protein